VPEPILYLNRHLTPQGSISLFDAGFTLGATATETLRTFRGEIFRMPEHLARLRHSLEIAGLKPRESLDDIAGIASRVVDHNRALIDADDDLSVSIFVTPGQTSLSPEDRVAIPTVGVVAYPLEFRLWAHRYEAGVSLVITSIRQVPANCWPPELKCRSRMHYFLADREAQKIEPMSRALLLDQAGFITEASTANVLAYYEKEGLVAPPTADVLPGISLQVVSELAGRLGIAFAHRKMLPDDLARADEAFLTSTPNCILPVTRFNKKPIGGGEPGAIFQKLLAAWNKMVGFDVAEQSRRFSRRKQSSR
jgi:branched-subunit amino acid aminotransferase/4-amino-4-deoxychorismate lyase